jgi:hypothetical protein
MRSTKIFIALLFLIALLFVVGINLGALHSDDQKPTTPDWTSSIGKVLANPQSLKMSDLNPQSPSCLQQGKIVIPIAHTCTFTITKSTFSLRVVTLQLVQGTGAVVSLSQEDSVTVQHTLAGTTTTPNDMKIYPGKEHGTLVIQCPDTGGAQTQCQLEPK